MFLQIAVIQLQKKLNQNRKNKIENWGLFYFFNRRLPLNLHVRARVPLNIELTADSLTNSL